MIEVDVLRWVELVATIGAGGFVVWRVGRAAGRIEATMEDVPKMREDIGDLKGRTGRLERVFHGKSMVGV